MKLFLALSLLLANSISQAQQPYLTQALDAKTLNSVVISTKGHIRVSGEPGQAARLEVTVTDINNRALSKDEAKRILTADYLLDITTTGGRVQAKAGPKKART